METNRKSFGGLAGILAGAGLGLMALTSAGCISQDSYAKDKAIYSASYPSLQSRPEIPEHGALLIDIKKGHSSVFKGNPTAEDIGKEIDVGTYKGGSEVYLRVSPEGARAGSLNLCYSDNINFSVVSYSGEDGFDDYFRKMYPHHLLEAYVNNPDNRKNNKENDEFGAKGKDILDSTGKLKQRIFSFPETYGIKLERIEYFDEKGMMIRAVITDKTSGKEVYVLEWDKKKKDYDIKLNSLEKKVIGK